MSNILQPFRGPLQAGLMGVGFAVSITAVQGSDKAWSFWMHEHRWPALVDFMGRTIFEGQALGGGDPVVLYLLAALIGYYLAWKNGPAGRFYRHRSLLGFVAVSAACWGLGIVHALKWAVGRARPFEVLFTGAPFTAWHDIGPHFVTEGIYHGSFPSGHTAQAALLLTLAYVLAAGAEHRAGLRPAAWLWTAVCLLFTTAMGAARVMALSHWLTDVIAGLFFTWIGIHASYHWILKVPAQVSFFRKTGRWPQAPEAWELRLSAWLLGTLAGFSMAVLGARALFRPGEALLGLLLPAGTGLLIVCFNRCRKLRKKALREMEGQTT